MRRLTNFMDKPIVLSRKSFVKIIAGICTGSFLWSWYNLSKDQVQKENQSEFRHSEDISLGISYFGKYFLYRTTDSVVAFSTICTHAGCRIGKSNSGILQCECHGSRFDAATGRPLKGPAIHPLRQFDCRFDSRTGEWIVKLQTPKDQPA